MDGPHRNTELENITEAPVHRRQLQQQLQTSARHHRDPLGPQQVYSQPHHHPQAQLSRSIQQGGQGASSCPSYLSMASAPISWSGQQQQQVQEEENQASDDVKTEGLLRSRKAVLPSEIRRRERSTEDPHRGRREEDVGLSRARSISHAKETATEEPVRGGAVSTRREETEHTSHLQAADSRPRGKENAIYIHKGPTAAHIQSRASHPRSSASRTVLKGLASETEDLQGLNQRSLQIQTQHPQEIRGDEGVSNGEMHQDWRLSVAQLRNSYIESTTTPPSSRRNEL